MSVLYLKSYIFYSGNFVKFNKPGKYNLWKPIVLGIIFLMSFLLISSSSLMAQTTRVEVEGAGWVESFPNYTNSWGSITVGSISGRKPGGTGNWRGRYITLSAAALSAGTYNINLSWYDNSTSDNSTQLRLQIGQRTNVSSPPNSTGTFGVDDSWLANAASAGQYIRSYSNISLSATDTIFMFDYAAGSGSNAFFDYIEFTPSNPNTNPPSINNQTFSVNENSASGTVVGTVVASDPDAGQSVVSYSITAGNTGNVFSVSNTGVITVVGPLDYETLNNYTLTVQVCDNGTPIYCSAATVTININDVYEAPNNFDPVITNAGVGRSIAENSYGGTPVGTALAATDGDGNSVYFHITGGNTGNAFYIDSTTGQIYVNGLLDYETLSSYSLTITAADNGIPSRSSTATVAINVTDVAESSPSMSLWYGTCSGDSVPIVANTIGATFAGWQISGGGITDISSPSSSSTYVINHSSSITYIAKAVVPTGANLVTNGDFEAGNTVTGFTSSYTYKSGSVSSPGQFGITQNADASQSYFVSSSNHTSGGSWYLYADGASTAGVSIYSTTVSVVAGQSYAFSAWFANGHDGTVNSNETAHLEFDVAGTYTGDILLPLDVGVWHQFTSAYTATSTGTITISIVNKNTNATKNDFFLDDITFQQANTITQSITVPSCVPPLPVELISFSVHKENNINILSWITSSEKNNNYFVIERSSNGKDFIAIGRVQGNGNASVYSYEDIKPLSGINYYRLRQVDFGGSVSYSNIVEEDNIHRDIEIYPNPNHGSFKINLPESMDSFELIITDLEGRNIYTASGEQLSETIEVMGLSTGLYIVRFYCDDQLIIKKLIVK